MCTVSRRRIAFGIIIGLFGLNVSRADSAEPGREWVILIGVNEYSNLTHLKCCVNDQQALQETLLRCGIRDEQMFVLHDQMKEQKYKPTRNNIKKQIDLVLDLVDQQHRRDQMDLVLIAFSGHGVQLPDESGRTVNYLCPVDADLENPQETMISVENLYSRLEKCRADFKMMVVDACRDDPKPPNKRTAKSASDANKSFAESLTAPRGGVLLTSCEPKQQAHEDPRDPNNPDGLGQGVFMYFLQKGLMGAADRNHDGKASVLELYEYVEHETGVYVARKFNGPQHPCLDGKVSGTWQFSVPQAPNVVTNSIGMELVSIPAGEFFMGNDDSVEQLMRLFPYANKTYFDDATVRHRVKITRPFLLGKYEVKIGQFRQFVQETGYITEAEGDGRGGSGYDLETKQTIQHNRFSWKYAGFDPEPTDDHPVVNVSWNDATWFCNWLSRKEGKPDYYRVNGTEVNINGGSGYSLPTEAEWEYACRGGTTTRYSHGGDPEGLAGVGNTWDAQAITRFPNAAMFIAAYDGYLFTAPVGRFKANRFGLHDMHGNVAEWCGDWYSNTYYATSPENDPIGPFVGTHRVLRGGSWGLPAAECRSADRGSVLPSVRDSGLGFRVAAGS